MRIVNPTAILGENAACDHLRKKGYEIIERNFRKKYCEIDVIARKGGVLVFIEVKTRSNSNFGTPFEAISKGKLQKIISAAKYYKYVLHPDSPDDLRIDAIGVLVRNGKIESIEHLVNVSSF